jgi:hypothetical protein
MRTPRAGAYVLLNPLRHFGLKGTEQNRCAAARGASAGIRCGILTYALARCDRSGLGRVGRVLPARRNANFQPLDVGASVVLDG